MICHLTRAWSQKNNGEVHSHLRCLVEKLLCPKGEKFSTFYPQPLYTASQVRTTSRSWDIGVLTDLCLTCIFKDPVRTAQ